MPVIVVGVLALSLATRRSGLLWATGLTSVVGLAGCVLAPTLILDRAAAGADVTADTVVTMWPGIGALVMMLGLIASGLVVTDPAQREPRPEPSYPRSSPGSPLTSGRARAGLAVAAVAVLLVAGATAVTSFGAGLQPWEDPRPAVAIDRAHGPLAQRQLDLTVRGDDVTYRLIGREPGPPARSLPPRLETDSDLESAVSAALGLGSHPPRRRRSSPKPVSVSSPCAVTASPSSAPASTVWPV